MQQEIVAQMFDLDAVRALARYHEQTAGLLKRRAVEIERRRKQTDIVRKRSTELQNSPNRVAALLADGRNLDTAITSTAEELQTYIATVAAHWRKFVRARSQNPTRRREILVARLAARGLSDNQIAERIGLNPKSIGRILRRALKSPAQSPPATHPTNDNSTPAPEAPIFYR